MSIASRPTCNVEDTLVKTHIMDVQIKNVQNWPSRFCPGPIFNKDTFLKYNVVTMFQCGSDKYENLQIKLQL